MFASVPGILIPLETEYCTALNARQKKRSAASCTSFLVESNSEKTIFVTVPFVLRRENFLRGHRDLQNSELEFGLLGGSKKTIGDVSEVFAGFLLLCEQTLGIFFTALDNVIYC